MTTKIILGVSAAILIVLLFVDQGVALKCWNCASNIDKNCSDTFQYDKKKIAQVSVLQVTCPPVPSTSSGPQCRKIKYKLNNEWIYIRGCDTQDNRAYSPDSHIFYCNNEDFCNAASVQTPAIAFTVLGLTSLLLRSFF